MCVRMHKHVQIPAQRSEEVTKSPGVGAIVIHHMWVLGTKLQNSKGTARTFSSLSLFCCSLFSVLFCFETGSDIVQTCLEGLRVTQDDLKFLILLLPSLKYRNFRHMPPCQLNTVKRVKFQSQVNWIQISGISSEVVS